jgi:hypothetical protein
VESGEYLYLRKVGKKIRKMEEEEIRKVIEKKGKRMLACKT